MSALLCAASAPLFFRVFVSVDGPKHALHAAIIEAQWTGDRFAAEGIEYDAARIGLRAGDLILMALMRVMSPQEASRAFAALVAALLALSLITWVGTHMDRLNIALLWAIPPLFSFLLVMGFFHFHLGMAVSLFSISWWRSTKSWSLPRVLGVAIALLLALWTHRGAPILILVLLVIDVVFDILVSPEKRRKARSLLIGAGTMLAMAAAAIFLQAIHQGVGVPESPGNVEYSPLFLLRPLLLLDHAKEGPPIFMMGILLAIAFGLCLVARWRLGTSLRADDAFLFMAITLAALSFLLDSTRSEALFLGVRCQWLALLVIVPWLMMMYERSKNDLRRAQQVVVLMMLPLQCVRWAHAEGAMADLEAPKAYTREAAIALFPGGLVVVGSAEPNWLLSNLASELAIAYDGVLTPGPTVRASGFGAFGPARLRYRLWELVNDPGALSAHWQDGQLPVVDHVVILGNNASMREIKMSDWGPVLKEHYAKTFDNGYAVVWTARLPDRLISAE